MAVQVNPVTPSLPATTAIQDPAARRFAQAVADSIRTAQTPEYAIQQLSTAAAGLFSGATPPAITQWLVSSELYQQLNAAIGRVDSAAQLAVAEERAARIQDIADEALARANEIAAEALARTDAVQNEANIRTQALLDEAAARDAAIGTEATIRQSEDESLAQSITTLTSSVSGSLSAIEGDLTTLSTDLGAEASARETLASQMRGSYTGNDLSAVTTGLLYQERIARSTAVDGLAQQITLLSAGAGEQFDYQKIWYFDSGVEGWTGNGTPTVSNGWIRPADHGSDPYIVSPTGIAAPGSTYPQVRLRIRKTGSPTWAGVLWWRTAADSTWDAARSATLVEPTYDGNGIGLVTVNLVWSGTIDRIRLDLSDAQAAGSGFEVDWVAIGRPSPGASNAALLEEQLARANADAVEVTARESLSTKITGAANPASLTLATLSSGLLFDERQARSTADASEVTARQALSAKITGFNDPAGKSLVDLTAGLLYEEKTARATQDTALAQSITTLTGRVGAAEAAIVSEQTARANEDIAIATSINGLSAQFGGNLTYSVLRQWEFASTVEGWVAGAATATVSNGILTWTTTGANPYISFTFATADRYMGSVASKIRARVRRTAGSQAWEGNCYYTTAAHGETTSYRKTIAAPTNPTAWTILEWDMSALTAGGSDYTANEIRSIRLDLVGTAGDTWQIDWISVGERVASPAALDAQENKAAITAEETARANADGVLATSISTLRSQIGVTEGGALTTGLIQSEKTTRASNDNAIVSAVNTALAQITGVSTSISQSGENLIASWSQAQASKWNQIESEVLTAGGQTIRAALAQEANTRSTLAGQVSSTWMVRAQIDSGTGKPYIAGIALGAEGQNGGATSEFIVQADKFVFTMPGYGNYVPFAIGLTGTEFTGLTNWSNVQGAAKPQDGATRNVFRGDWATSTAYVVGDIVLKDGNGWSCIVAHTAASGNQPPSSGSGNTWWTLYAVKGADGANAIVAVLSNETHVVPTDSAGNNGNYSGAATTITIYNGTSNDSANWTVTASASNVTGSLSGKTYTVSGLSADTGYVDLTAARSGYASIVKRFVLSKSKAGAVGAQGPAVVVTSSRATTFTATDGVLDGSQADIVLTAAVSGVTGPTYVWTFSGLQTNPTASTTNTQTITAAQFGTAKSATVTCTVNGTYKDQVTLVRLEKSTAAAGATVGSNLSDPFSTATWYPEHHTFETVPDGKVGSLVLRLNTGLSNPEQIRYIPLDRTKKYRVRFWARPQAGANGTLFFALRQYISPGVFGPGNTGLAPYKPASVTPGVHNTNFGTDAWGEYSYIWTTADWQADVTLVRPLFLRNYGGTVGYWEVQDLRFEEVTEVEAAKDSAAAANALLADIAADSKLTPVEKQSVRAEWDTVYAERAGIRTQADGFSITTEKTAYDTAFQALGTYLNAGAAYTIGSTPPSWIADAGLSSTTDIVGATFRANWSNLYADRQALLNKISAEAAKKADWANVTNKTGFASISQITPSNVTTYIANAAIGTAQIKDAAIDTAQIKDAAIDTAQIKDAAIDTLKVGAGSVTSMVYGSGGLATASVGAGATWAAAVAIAMPSNSTGVTIFCTINMNTSGGTGYVILSIVGNGTTLRTVEATIRTDTAGYVISAFDPAPLAGTNQYTLYVNNNGSTAVRFDAGTVMAVGGKR